MKGRDCAQKMEPRVRGLIGGEQLSVTRAVLGWHISAIFTQRKPLARCSVSPCDSPSAIQVPPREISSLTRYTFRRDVRRVVNAPAKNFRSLCNLRVHRFTRKSRGVNQDQAIIYHNITGTSISLSLNLEPNMTWPNNQRCRENLPNMRGFF